MIKYIILLFNLIGLFLYQLFFQANVTVTQMAPSSAALGESFVIRVTINKADVSGFAKFQEDLPKGFTATAIDKQGATVLSSDDAIKFIWASLPSDATIKIAFRVTADSTVSGAQMLVGKFLYVVNNEKQEADASSSVTITGSASAPVANTSAPADTNNTSITPPADTNKPVLPATSNTSVSVTSSCSPSSVEPAGNVTVSLTIHKGNLGGFAKLEEDIPNGLVASEGDKQGASFTFVDNKAKFVWLNLPADSVFTVSYKLAVGSTVSGDQSISGGFSYLVNNNAMNYQITATSFSVQIVSQPVTNTTPPVTNTTPPVSNETANAVTPNIPEASGSVKYRVQIMALHNPVKASYLGKKYGIGNPINEEMLEGYTKYTVGSYKEYKFVRDYREVMKSKGVAGPFVVAYNSGKRITVQEALMITHQQWYR